MGQVENIIKDHDVFTQEGFEQAMRKVKHVPEGELHHLAGYNPSWVPNKPFQQAIALARAELGRRAAAEQRKLIYITALAGVFGVMVGAALQYLLG